MNFGDSRPINGLLNIRPKKRKIARNKDFLLDFSGARQLWLLLWSECDEKQLKVTSYVVTQGSTFSAFRREDCGCLRDCAADGNQHRSRRTVTFDKAERITTQEIRKVSTREDIEQGTEFTPKFDDNGLIPAIAQDAETGQILMTAYMNPRALAKEE